VCPNNGIERPEAKGFAPAFHCLGKNPPTSATAQVLENNKFLERRKYLPKHSRSREATERAALALAIMPRFCCRPVK
jgi:hypothetical protein